mgnify:CR=1 FL=1
MRPRLDEPLQSCARKRELLAGNKHGATSVCTGFTGYFTAICISHAYQSEMACGGCRNDLLRIFLNALQGEENAQIEEVPGGKGLTPGDVRTPNALQQQLRGSRLTGTISDTPLTAGQAETTWRLFFDLWIKARDCVRHASQRIHCFFFHLK